ncbi:hypothetical protein BV509_16705 [Rhodovulum sulfidophilum]|nr:hypothetical protein BV509_16705 [Rhodovulum sulfidophilum]
MGCEGKMQDKPLESVELDLLAIIRQIHAEEGPFGRDLLLVRARGRGLEVSRPLGRLKALGLVEEIQRKPFLLRRIFGAMPVALLRPTAAGLALGETAAEDSPAEGAAETPAEPPVTAPARTAAAKAPTSKPAPPEAKAAAPEARAEPAPQPANVQQPADPAPVSAPEPQIAPPEQPTSVVAAPAPAPAPAADDLPLPMPRRAAPRNLRGYTEELGGSPAPVKTVPLRHNADPALMENLREALAVIGIEMTFAGEALIADRMEHGASIGEALSQVVLFAFAHAVAEDAREGGQLQAMGLTDYAVDVIAEFERLRDAGEISGDRLEEDMRRLWTLVGDSPERLSLAQELLADPVGGLTPPALLPEDLRPAEDA